MSKAEKLVLEKQRLLNEERILRNFHAMHNSGARKTLLTRTVTSSVLGIVTKRGTEYVPLPNDMWREFYDWLREAQDRRGERIHEINKELADDE